MIGKAFIDGTGDIERLQRSSQAAVTIEDIWAGIRERDEHIGVLMRALRTLLDDSSAREQAVQALQFRNPLVKP